MKFYFLLYILANSLCLITELNDQNYEEFINNNEVVFLKIFVPWCGHCKALEKPFKDLSELFKNKNIEFA